MMASKILSRFLPGTQSAIEGSYYDHPENQRMLEAGGPQDHDDPFKDFEDEQELDDMLVETPLRQHKAKQSHRQPRPPKSPENRDPVSRLPPAPLPEDDSETGVDVPLSLIMEDDKTFHPPYRSPPQPEATSSRKPWQEDHHQQEQHQAQPPLLPHVSFTAQTRPARRTRLDRRDQALWRWANVENVDGFLLEVYSYYTNQGIWSILLARILHLLTTAFLFSAYMFLSTCIDYSKIPTSKATQQIIIPNCMAETSFFKSVLLWTFVFWWLWKLFGSVTDIGRLWQLHDFYHYLLGIADEDIQTIAWERVVESLMGLRDSNPETADKIPKYMRKVAKTTQSKQRMDAHDIANRLMRRDNYYIALVNKEILDLQLDIPFLGTRNFYSKSLEWCVATCFESFIFDTHGHVQQRCLDPKERLRMIETLRLRFRRVAVMSVLMGPFNIALQCIIFFSKYYAEYRNAPNRLGARAFTPLAEWKMRDFNELEHDFNRRLKMACPSADGYLAQFPRDKTIQMLQFVSLVAGTVAAVLGIATLLDHELFLGFEVTPGRTAFFYLSVSMGIFAATRGAVPDDSEVHAPVWHLFEAIAYTHYAPQRWKNNYHTPAVRAEFSALYQMKVLIFLDEILSLVAAPFILWKNSGKASAAIIDFFRQNTVHVDGLGGLCNHAVFEFRKRTRPEDDDASDAAHELRDEYFGTAAKDQKMAQSQYYFMQRLGQYEGRSTAATQGAKMHHHLPPAFPPLSPLREAARPQRRHQRRPDSSPARSALLDVAAARRRTQRGPRKDHAAEHLDLPRADADLTTSKLIEADHSLADSWKFDEDEIEASSTPPARREDRSGGEAGVVGLLMEYTRAREKPGSTRRS